MDADDLGTVFLLFASACILLWAYFKTKENKDGDK